MITFRGSRGDRQGATSLCRRSQGAAFAPRAPAPLLVVARHGPRAAFAPMCSRLSLCAPRAGTSTYLPNVNVPFSHPSDLYPQKNGRKVRSRDEGTFTSSTVVDDRRAPPSATHPARSALRRNHSSASGSPGPLPARSPDRSHSAPRSVRLRLDDSRGHCLPSRRARRAGCAARSRGRGAALPGTASIEAAVLHIRVRSALTKTLESCGNVDSVAARIPLPCAQTPLGAHGSPAAERGYRRESA